MVIQHFKLHLTVLISWFRTKNNRNETKLNDIIYNLKLGDATGCIANE